MSGFGVRAVVTLDKSSAPRRSGWRGVCEFDGVLSADGAKLFGFEANLESAEEMTPGNAAEVTLHLWAPMPPSLSAPRAVRLFDGGNEVGHGHVTDVIHGEQIDGT